MNSFYDVSKFPEKVNLQLDVEEFMELVNLVNPIKGFKSEEFRIHSIKTNFLEFCTRYHLPLDCRTKEQALEEDLIDGLSNHFDVDKEFIYALWTGKAWVHKP